MNSCPPTGTMARILPRTSTLVPTPFLWKPQFSLLAEQRRGRGPMFTFLSSMALAFHLGSPEWLWKYPDAQALPHKIK